MHTYTSWSHFIWQLLLDKRVRMRAQTVNAFEKTKNNCDSELSRKFATVLAVPSVCTKDSFLYLCRTFRASNFRRYFIWLHRSIPRNKPKWTKPFFDQILKARATYVPNCFPFVRKDIGYKGHVLSVLFFLIFISFVVQKRFFFSLSAVLVLLFVLDIAFTFNAHRASIPNHFCAHSHSMRSLNRPVCMFGRSSSNARNPTVVYLLCTICIFISLHINTDYNGIFPFKNETTKKKNNINTNKAYTHKTSENKT